MMGIYPPRSVVRLSTGAVAIVLAANAADAARPVIRLIAAPDGQLVPPEDVVLQDSPELAVTACLDPQRLNIDVDDYL
jgi:hypothetical protein